MYALLHASTLSLLAEPKAASGQWARDTLAAGGAGPLAMRWSLRKASDAVVLVTIAL